MADAPRWAIQSTQHVQRAPRRIQRTFALTTCVADLRHRSALLCSSTPSSMPWRLRQLAAGYSLASQSLRLAAPSNVRDLCARFCTCACLTHARARTCMCALCVYVLVRACVRACVRAYLSWRLLKKSPRDSASFEWLWIQWTESVAAASAPLQLPPTSRNTFGAEDARSATKHSFPRHAPAGPGADVDQRHVPFWSPAMPGGCRGCLFGSAHAHAPVASSRLALYANVLTRTHANARADRHVFSRPALVRLSLDELSKALGVLSA